MSLRAPAPEDAEAVVAVVAARDVADFGEPDYDLGALRDEWGASDFDLAVDAVVAERDGRLVGYAGMRGNGALAVVHPDHEGQGVGAELLAWSEARARARGAARHRQVVGSGNARARELLERAGYAQGRSYWRMWVALPTAGPLPPAPLGVSARPPSPNADAEAEALHAVSERAFAAQNADYDPEPLARFREEHLQAHDLAPELSRVAVRAGRPVGLALARRWETERRVYVDLLAVDPDARGQGIGPWLLAAVFAAAGDAGLTEGLLSVASDNPGAITLYERAGMAERWRLDEFARALG